MKDHKSGNFSELLQAWRLQRGLTQAQLDQRLERTSTFVRNLEAGVNKPPDFAMCKRIAEVLGLPARVVWDAAREQRLRAFDEDLYRHYVLGERVDALPGDVPNPEAQTWTAEETFLIQTLRWLDEDVPRVVDLVAGDEPLAGVLEDALLTLFIDGAEPGAHPEPPPARAPTSLARECVDALRTFSELSVTKQAALMRVFVAAVAAAKSEVPGEGRTGARRSSLRGG